MAGGWVYIVTNKRGGTLYIGVTSDLQRRIGEHRAGTVAGFTKRYNLTRLIFAEFHDEIAMAIQREKTLKSWNREWKEALIARMNPDWDDLYERLF